MVQSTRNTVGQSFLLHTSRRVEYWNYICRDGKLFQSKVNLILLIFLIFIALCRKGNKLKYFLK